MDTPPMLLVPMCHRQQGRIFLVPTPLFLPDSPNAQYVCKLITRPSTHRTAENEQERERLQVQDIQRAALCAAISTKM